jgi:hypothetical protein
MSIQEELNLININETYNVLLTLNGCDYNSITANLSIPENEANRLDFMWLKRIKQSLIINPESCIKNRIEQIEKKEFIKN